MAKVEKTQLDKDMAAALALIHKQFGEESMQLRRLILFLPVHLILM